MLHAIVRVPQKRPDEVPVKIGLKPKAVRSLIIVSPRGEFLRAFDTTGGKKRGKPPSFRSVPLPKRRPPLGTEFDQLESNTGGGNAGQLVVQRTVQFDPNRLARLVK